MSISKLAHINKNVVIGENATIAPFVNIEEDVEIGKNCWIGSNVTILQGSRIGDNCKIFPGAVIGAIPQDLKYNNEKTLAIIGNNCTIRECVTINKGTIANQKTQVGNNCLLMAYVHIAHDCVLGNNVILANNVNLAGHVKIEDNAILEGLVAAHQFVQIGQYSFVSGGSLVRKDVPPFVKAAREPLSYAGINSIGLRRKGFEKEAIVAIQDVYRILFVKKFKASKALHIIETELPVSKEKDTIIEFINNSVRGIMKGYQSIYQ